MRGWVDVQPEICARRYVSSISHSIAEGPRVNAVDIFSKWPGESEQHLKEFFARAQTQVPAIIYIDEIDAIAERRGGPTRQRTARNAVVNMFLTDPGNIFLTERLNTKGQCFWHATYPIRPRLAVRVTSGS